LRFESWPVSDKFAAALALLPGIFRLKLQMHRLLLSQKNRALYALLG
jgi:hypothetical protein